MRILYRGAAQLTLKWWSCTRQYFADCSTYENAAILSMVVALISYLCPCSLLKSSGGLTARLIKLDFAHFIRSIDKI